MMQNEISEIGTIKQLISVIRHPKPAKKESQLTYEDMTKSHRPVLGTNGVVVWRLLRRLAMPKILGKATTQTIFLISKRLGKMLPAKNIQQLLELGKELNIGVFSIVAREEDRLLIQLDECITCSGTPNIGKAVCDLELGLVAGAIEKITKKRTVSKEVKCNGLGDGTCWLDYKLY